MTIDKLSICWAICPYCRAPSASFFGFHWCPTLKQILWLHTHSQRGLERTFIPQRPDLGSEEPLE